MSVYRKKQIPNERLSKNTVPNEAITKEAVPNSINCTTDQKQL